MKKLMMVAMLAGLAGTARAQTAWEQLTGEKLELPRIPPALPTPREVPPPRLKEDGGVQSQPALKTAAPSDGVARRLQDLFNEYAGSADGARFKDHCWRLDGVPRYEVEAGSHGLRAVCSVVMPTYYRSHSAPLPAALLAKNGFHYDAGSMKLRDLSWNDEVTLEHAGGAMRAVFGGAGSGATQPLRSTLGRPLRR